MHENRWFILAVLFLARLAMAFQFQAVAALSPIYTATFGVTLAEIGFLIGLYLSPGLIIAIPGAAIGQRFGDRTVIAFGMGLMVAGALVMLMSTSWDGQIIGRLLAGVGGVLLNVLMSKVVADQFAGREIATAMGIFINSWPVGIAAALLFLPLLGGAQDPQGAEIAVLVATLVGLALFLVGTQALKVGAQEPVAPLPLRGAALGATVVAGGIWGLYNGALSMVFAFGPAMLVERGWTLAAASSTTSVVLWLAAVSVPLGGILADRFQSRDRVMVTGFVFFAAGLCLAPNTDAVLLLFIALGLVCGLSAGPIMSLPAAVLSPGNRAYGMGVYFTLFYVGVVFAPIVAGWVAAHSGTSSATFYLGAVLIALCCGGLVLFKRLQRIAGDRGQTS